MIEISDAHHGPALDAEVPAVEMAGVTKVFGSGELAVEALKGIDLVVRPGEFLMLAGPSGSGKTTLLSILGCVLTPTEGKAHLFGEPLSGRPESELPLLRLQYVGFVFQDPHLLPALTASQNVELPLLLRGWTPGDAAAEAATALSSVGLGAMLERRPQQLSGGEKQRVSIARAIAGRPPLILADEPTSSLDARSGHHVVELLRELATQRGHTVIVVTHDNRIFPLADRLVHIDDGRLVDDPETEKTTTH